MTITLTPEIEAALAKAARRQGTTPEQVALETLKAGLLPPAPGEAAPTQTAEARERRRQEALTRIRSGYYASRLPSSEDFAAHKAEEKAREERRWRP